MLAAAAEALVCSVLVRRERSKRRLAESDVDESRARMVEMQQLARIGNWEFDLLNDRIRWTEETFRIFGIPPGSQEPEFADVLLAIEDEDKSVFDAAIQGAITEGRPYSLDLRIRTPEGTQKFIHAQGTAVYAATGTVVRLIGTVLDITERKWEENRLATAATHDSLTGLANRSCFSMELEREIHTAREAATPLSMCMCDIDKFKRINDTYGHGAGDEVIQALANCLTEGVRRGDLAARWGGDEFASCSPARLPPMLREPWNRIRQKLETLTFTAHGSGQFGVTGTFGIAELLAGMTGGALLDAADRALYSAKGQGRNRLACASSIPE